MKCPMRESMDGKMAACDKACAWLVWGNDGTAMCAVAVIALRADERLYANWTRKVDK